MKIEKYVLFVKECISGWSNKEKDMAMIYSMGGVMEEANELEDVLDNPSKKYREKVISEAGDVLWYMVAFMLSMGLEEERIIAVLSSVESQESRKVTKISMEAYKITSKHVFYGNPLEGIEMKLAIIIGKLRFICKSMVGVEFDIVMSENERKIDLRYPKGRHTQHIEKHVENEISKMKINDGDKGTH